jgi:hypothetical protein
MDSAHLQDRISWGLNIASRKIGATADAYRPRGSHNPLEKSNRFLRLNVAFSPVSGGFSHSNRYGNAIWDTILDSAYIQPGDYLVISDAIWFVADRHPLLPVLCVRANRTVSFSQPASAVPTGSTSYSGVTSSTSILLMSNWPASVLGAGGQGAPEAALPSDGTVPYWTVLVPGPPNVIISPSDIMSDDLGRNAVVEAAELSSMGWRLNVKQATT